MSFPKKTAPGQTNPLAPSIMDVDLAASNPMTGNSPASLPSDPQARHPPTSSRHSSKQSCPAHHPSDAQTVQSQTAPPHPPPPPSTRIPCSEFERDYGDTDLESLPAGFPYVSWYGAWCFACEFVCKMQALVTERMEGTGKYGPVRRTT